MLDAVDEECRCAVHTTTSPTLDVALHALHIHMRCQITLKPLDIKADVGRIMGKVVISQRILVLEQLVMHLPEPALRGSRLRCLRGMTRVRIDGTREVAEGTP